MGVLIIIGFVIIKFVLSSLKWIFVIAILALIGWIAYGQLNKEGTVGDVGRVLNPETVEEDTKESAISNIFDSLLDVEKKTDEHFQDIRNAE